jgi:hypothetical protein
MASFLIFRVPRNHDFHPYRFGEAGKSPAENARKYAHYLSSRENPWSCTDLLLVVPNELPSPLGGEGAGDEGFARGSASKNSSPDRLCGTDLMVAAHEI